MSEPIQTTDTITQNEADFILDWAEVFLIAGTYERM